MKTLLVMTVGQTDVQLVVGNQRQELDGKTCGKLHDIIEQRTCQFAESPDIKMKKRADHLPDGDLMLCTPKLDAVLAYFDGTWPSAALIFETRREFDSDPRYAGIVVERRLRAGGVDQVVRSALLTGKEKLEDPSNDVDAIVRQAVVKSLSNAIAAELKDVNPERVILALTGGMPQANTVINELLRLHAVGGPEVVSLEIPDSSITGGRDRAIPERFHPASGFRARWHALSLIEKGNLLGAWGAVRHLEGAPGQNWTQVVNWLAQFASSLPFAPPLPTDCGLDVLSHPRMAVRAALRVELALRAGDIPRAVHGTVAFFEAALWDKLGERIERSSDEKKRRFFQIKSGVSPTGDKLLRKGDGSDEDRKRPFELKETVDGVAWYWVFDGDGGPAARLAKYFLQCDALTNFDKALGSTIRELRNDIAHNEPTPDLMNEARTHMQTAQLWSNNDTFLSQPLVQAVLKELGEPRPEQLCINFVSTVRERLRAVD